MFVLFLQLPERRAAGKTKTAFFFTYSNKQNLYHCRWFDEDEFISPKPEPTQWG